MYVISTRTFGAINARDFARDGARIRITTTTGARLVIPNREVLSVGWR